MWRLFIVVCATAFVSVKTISAQRSVLRANHLAMSSLEDTPADQLVAEFEI